MGSRGPISRKVKPTRATEKNTEPAQPLSLDEASLVEWSRITGLLRQRNALDALDEKALADYLLCWQRLRECEAEIARDGVTISSERGIVKHPAAQLARQYRDSMLAWSKEIGLTFASRARLEMRQPVPKAENPWAKFRPGYHQPERDV